MHRDHDDLWEDVRNTKEAIRARAKLIFYTLGITVPFIVLAASGAVWCGLRPHEVTGISCYNAMASSLFFFDTLRNTAHACFEEARAAGLVTCRSGVPIVDQAYRYHRIARLAFAIGGVPRG